jgi:hypothetical protein
MRPQLMGHRRDKLIFEPIRKNGLGSRRLFASEGIPQVTLARLERALVLLGALTRHAFTCGAAMHRLAECTDDEANNREQHQGDQITGDVGLCRMGGRHAACGFWRGWPPTPVDGLHDR